MADALDARPDLGGHTAGVRRARHSDAFATKALMASQPKRCRGFSTSTTAAAMSPRSPQTERGTIAGDPRRVGDDRHVLRRNGSTARLIASGTHLWDAEYASISVINLATLREIGEVSGVELDPRRFRANVYLDGLDPWEEFTLSGRTISVGGAVLQVLEPQCGAGPRRSTPIEAAPMSTCPQSSTPILGTASAECTPES